MTALEKVLREGRFIHRWDYLDFGYKDTKAFDNALYKLRKKGLDIRSLSQGGQTVYYLKA